MPFPRRRFGVAARAASVGSDYAIDKTAYSSNTAAAAGALQGWYNVPEGLWNTTNWWNGANCLTVLADYGTQDKPSLDIPAIIANTFTNAQKIQADAQKSIMPSGLVQSRYTLVKVNTKSLATDTFPNFINDYYDDEGWWGLGLVRSWDLTKDPAYLNMAESIFEDMKGGGDDVCKGGIWWSKDKNYKNAIANELYLSLAASLANRVPAKKSYYQDIATNQWTWFKGTGMINENNTINDGLDIGSDGVCTNNNKVAWSYNQGVVLGGLVELSKATGDQSYMREAQTIADAAIALLSDGNGIIHDVGCEPGCGADANQFKGIFVRNLALLHAASPRDNYKECILKNAQSIWASDRDGLNNHLGVVWSGPPEVGGGPTAATHSSAMDALVAAIRVSGQ